MTQMWLLWWPKNNVSGGAKTSTSTSTSSAVTATSVARKKASTSSHCNCIAKLLRKLKKRGRVLCSTTGESSSSSAFQCRYDPLSYSLNFDSSGCGGSLLDEHYYQFCAFSSRFASNQANLSQPAPPHVTLTSSR